MSFCRLGALGQHDVPGVAVVVQPVQAKWKHEQKLLLHIWSVAVVQRKHAHTHRRVKWWVTANSLRYCSALPSIFTTLSTTPPPQQKNTTTDVGCWPTTKRASDQRNKSLTLPAKQRCSFCHFARQVASCITSSTEPQHRRDRRRLSCSALFGPHLCHATPGYHTL